MKSTGSVPSELSSTRSTSANARGLARRRAREDDVFHGLTAQVLGIALAKHPQNGIGDVRFARTVRTHNGRNARLERKRAAVGKRFETLEHKRLQVHGRYPCFRALVKRRARFACLRAFAFAGRSFSAFAALAAACSGLLGSGPVSSSLPKSEKLAQTRKRGTSPPGFRPPSSCGPCPAQGPCRPRTPAQRTCGHEADPAFPQACKWA